jgi:formylglycine-generating enzyme required for sulfatase activity
VKGDAQASPFLFLRGQAMHRYAALICSCLIVCLLALTQQAAAAGRRVALVIGNANYSDTGTLVNPHADADAVATALKSAGFDDVRHVTDVTANDLRNELKQFSALAANAEMAVVYYAGHGVEVADQNYLIPVDAKLARSTDIEFEAVSLASVRSAVSGATKLRLVVLDACRNNPFKLVGNGGTRAATRGLATIEPSAGEVVAYAAKEGTLAQDGPANANSPFATALVKGLKTPELEIRLLFGQIRDDVLAATNNEQEPYTYASLGGSALYLNETRTPKSFRDCDICPEMVEVPAGSFMMGSPETEKLRDPDEGPQHPVTLRSAFAVGKHEVTVGEFNSFLAATGHDMGTQCVVWTGDRFAKQQNVNFATPGFAQTDSHPATCLSWRDAKAYVAWLSKRSGFTYRLLTEAEWEYAARAGEQGPYSTGNNLDAGRVNFNSSATREAGDFAANAFGLHDMLGNVWEWTEDCYAKDYSATAQDGTAFVSDACERTYRGGSWANVAKHVRFAVRGANDDTKRTNIFGLRVARDLQ